jgi:hypothetical protein
MHAWRCPLAAGGGAVDGASEPRRATRHDGECQHTLPTWLHARGGSARRWPPRHAFSSRSLASGVACSRTLSLSGRLQNPIGAALTRQMKAGSGDGMPRCTAADATAQGGRHTCGHPCDERVVTGGRRSGGICSGNANERAAGEDLGKTTPTGGSHLSAMTAW